MTSLSFTSLDDLADITFNQLLGINNEGVIAGYFGSGAAGHPNKGYTLSPPYAQGNYQNENFPGSVQTQVTGLNDRGDTVGFWVDANGDNYGFVEHDGQFTTAVDPSAVQGNGGTPALMEQFMGINDRDQAVGFYLDAMGNAHSFVYDVGRNRFDALNIDGFNSVTATGINNHGEISGFVVNADTDEGFVRDASGKVTLLTGPQGATSSEALGLNDKGEVVGEYTNSSGVHGFVYNERDHTYLTVDDPDGVGTTTVNGINDKGQLVGFYVDSAGNTDGMLVNVNVTGQHHA
jgi:uncharacterized membrane protein